MPLEKLHHSIVVVGGGVVGLCCALRLQQRGFRTILVAPADDSADASWGNAGHIATEQVAPLASLATVKSLPGRLFSCGGAVALPWRDIRAWLPFALRLLAASGPRRFSAGKEALGSALALALPAWRRLGADIGAPDLLREEGHLVAWESAATAAAGRAAWAAADIGTTRFRDATLEELALLAQVSGGRVAGAIRFSGSAQVTDLAALAEALRGAFVGLGGEIRHRKARRIAPVDGDVLVLLEDGGAIAARAAVVAAGVGAKPLLEPLGHLVPIIAERGYHLQAPPAQAWPPALPPVVFEDRSMIVTPFRSGLRAASFVEFGHAGTAPDPRKWQRLRQHAEALGLPIGADAREWMGARPTLPDYLPAIGRSRRAPQIFYAFGHQHLGLTLAPLTGEAIAALVAEQAPLLDLAPFSIDRFDRRF